MKSNPKFQSFFEQVTAKNNAPIQFASEAPPHSYTTDLKGSYQQANLQTAVTALRTLRERGWNLPSEALKSGLGAVVSNTGLTGRWQTLSTSPLTICDIGHNADGIGYVLEQIEATPHAHLHFVLGMVNDKELEQTLSVLPQNATFYFCQAEIPRALDKKILQQTAARFSINGNTYKSVQNALQNAQKNAQANDLVFVGGSAFVVAEAL